MTASRQQQNRHTFRLVRVVTLVSVCLSPRVHHRITNHQWGFRRDCQNRGVQRLCSLAFDSYHGVGKLRAQARVCVFMHIHLTSELSDLPSCVDMSLNWGTMHFTAVKTHALLYKRAWAAVVCRRHGSNYRSKKNGCWFGFVAESE